MNQHHPIKYRGMTMIELLVSMAMASFIIAGISGVIFQTLQTKSVFDDKQKLEQQLDFAFSRMVKMVLDSPQLVLPLSNNPNSSIQENDRLQTVPATTSTNGITQTAVLAVTMPARWDLDGDGFPDADNDRDGLIDEDIPDDASEDTKNGLYNIDDDNDGIIDEQQSSDGKVGDDDEGKSSSPVSPDNDYSEEDPQNGIDDDNDGSIDEDTPADMNGDGCPGICGVDDDNDGEVDEGDLRDDDEDGINDEDWIEPIVYYLDGDELKERIPVPWTLSNNNSNIWGQDVTINTIAENVTEMHIIRQPDEEYATTVFIKLSLTNNEHTVTRSTTVRIGGNLD